MYYSATPLDNIITNLPIEVQNIFLSLGKRLSIKKNEYLLQEGQICQHLYIIEEGIFRTYRTIMKNEFPLEVISSFSFPNDFDTSPSSLILKIPAYENIQALTDAKVMAFDLSELHTLQNTYSEFNKLIFNALIDYIAALETVLFEFRVLSARERYEKLLNEHPNYIQQIPLKYLASFLNMREETLSRIRKP